MKGYFKCFLLGTELVAKLSAGDRVGVGRGSSPLLCPVSGVRGAAVCTTGGVPCNRNTPLTGCRSAAAVDVSLLQRLFLAGCS